EQGVPFFRSQFPLPTPLAGASLFYDAVNQSQLVASKSQLLSERGVIHVLRSPLEKLYALLEIRFCSSSPPQFHKKGPPAGTLCLPLYLKEGRMIRVARQMTRADLENRLVFTLGQKLPRASDIREKADRLGGDRLNLFIAGMLSRDSHRQ